MQVKTEGMGLELWHSGRILEFSDLEGCSRGGCCRHTVQEQCVHWGFSSVALSSIALRLMDQQGRALAEEALPKVTEESGVGTYAFIPDTQDVEAGGSLQVQC